VRERLQNCNFTVNILTLELCCRALAHRRRSITAAFATRKCLELQEILGTALRSHAGSHFLGGGGPFCGRGGGMGGVPPDLGSSHLVHMVSGYFPKIYAPYSQEFCDFGTSHFIRVHR